MNFRLTRMGVYVCGGTPSGVAMDKKTVTDCWVAASSPRFIEVSVRVGFVLYKGKGVKTRKKEA